MFAGKSLPLGSSNSARFSPTRRSMQGSLVPSVPAPLCIALCIALLALPSDGLRTYDKSATLPGGPAELSWSISSKKASLGLVVTDAGVMSGDEPWLGVGIGDPHSGGMLGADIATGLIDADGTCSIQDRHVPSVAYPLEEADGGSAVFPDEDVCGPPAWKLVACEVDADAGTMTLEVDRDLEAQNPAEDRDIDSAWNVVLVAWGDGFGYHGGNRLSVEVNFTKDGTESVGASSLEEAGLVPADAVAKQRLKVADFEIPERETTYMCQGFTIDRPEEGGPRQVVAAEPVLNFTSPSGKMVHHYVLYSCENDEKFQKWSDTPLVCEEEQPTCRDIVYAWAKGQGPLLYPEIAGFPVADDERHYVLQVHYDNPDGTSGVVDSESGILLHFTDTPRELDAGTINIGDPFVSLVGNEVLDSYNYTMECPNECISQLAQPVNVFQSFLHAHLSGMELWTNMYRDGEFLKTLESTAFWSNDNQRNTLKEQTELRPSDSLVIGGNYDTAKRRAAGEEPVTWGLGTRNEMLMSFLFVYPRPYKSNGISLNYCGLLPNPTQNVTMCSDGVNFENSTEVIPKDPFDLSVEEAGFSTSFGGAPQCQLSDSGTTAPSVTTTADESEDGDGDDDGPACFPSDARVELESGRMIAMSGLEVGDRVLVDVGMYSEVFMFTHKVHDTAGEFFRVTTSSGPEITATGGHYVVALDRGLVPFNEVSVGDRLFLATGDLSAVTSIERVNKRGLFNPQTLQGQIVVNGIVASTYTKAIYPPLAHAVLNPLRLLYRSLEAHISCFEMGAPALLHKVFN